MVAGRCPVAPLTGFLPRCPFRLESRTCLPKRRSSRYPRCHNRPASPAMALPADMRIPSAACAASVTACRCWRTCRSQFRISSSIYPVKITEISFKREKFRQRVKNNPLHDRARSVPNICEGRKCSPIARHRVIPAHCQHDFAPSNWTLDYRMHINYAGIAQMPTMIAVENRMCPGGTSCQSILKKRHCWQYRNAKIKHFMISIAFGISSRKAATPAADRAQRVRVAQPGRWRIGSLREILQLLTA